MNFSNNGYTINKKCILKHSKFLLVPILSQFLYFFQLLLLKIRLTNTIFLGGQTRKLSNFTIKACNEDFNQFECQTIELGLTLKRFFHPITLNLRTHSIPYKLSTYQYENLMWSLTFSSYLSPSTFKELDNKVVGRFSEIFS